LTGSVCITIAMLRLAPLRVRRQAMAGRRHLRIAKRGRDGFRIRIAWIASIVRR